MSGGHFEYVDERLKDIIFGWTNKPRNVFEDREISELVWDVLDLIHDFDWYKSGDSNLAAWIKAKNDFKNKWLNKDRELQVKHTIDMALEEVRQELYETYIIADPNRKEKESA